METLEIHETSSTGGAMPVSLEGRKREVIQLLKDYGAWHAAYGAAGELNFESRGQYGPAGMIFKGMVFNSRERAWLEESFDLLDKALIVLKHEHFEAWLLLKRPFTGDPGDPSIIDVWREKNPGLMEWYHFAITKLAEYLRFQDLYVAWPKRINSRRPANVKESNDEFYRAYQQLKKDGETNRRAIQIAGEWCKIGEARGYEIVKVRTTGVKRERKKA